MFKALAESWYWDPEVVEKLTPQQVIHLSGKPAPTAGGTPTPGGKIALTSQADYDYWTALWLKANSEEALLKRAERHLSRERERLRRTRG